jgi:hypothetical protein
MNPSVKQSLIDAAMERDSAATSSEWLGEFRNDISAFVPREVVESCVDVGERERPRPHLTRHRYSAFSLAGAFSAIRDDDDASASSL